MTDNPSLAALDARLVDLEAHIARFEAEHQPETSPLIQGLRARQRDLRAKVRAAIARGDMSDAIGAEFARDFEALETEISAAIVGSGG